MPDDPQLSGPGQAGKGHIDGLGPRVEPRQEGIRLVGDVHAQQAAGTVAPVLLGHLGAVVVEPGEVDASEVLPVCVDDIGVVQVAVGAQQGMLRPQVQEIGQADPDRLPAGIGVCGSTL